MVDPSGLEGGYWEGVGEVFKGYGDAIAGTANGLWTMARHPIQTAQGIGSAVRHPILTGQAILGDIREKSGTLRGQGELVGDVLQGVAAAGMAFKAASKSATVAKLTSKFKRLRKFKKPKVTCPVEEPVAPRPLRGGAPGEGEVPPAPGTPGEPAPGRPAPKRIPGPRRLQGTWQSGLNVISAKMLAGNSMMQSKGE